MILIAQGIKLTKMILIILILVILRFNIKFNVTDGPQRRGGSRFREVRGEFLAA